MAYRTSGRTQPSDTAVACARCATLASVSLASNRDGRFTCRKCELDQPVLRNEDELGSTKLELSDYHLGGYDQLRPFAREHGKDFDCLGVDLVCDGLECRLALSINSGTVMGLDHFVTTTGLPKMRFFLETPSHVDGKARGVIKEVQTGDAAFDDEVYIESSCSDADALTVLSSPAVRKAIRELLAESGTVTMNEGFITVFIENNRGPYIPKDITKRVSLMRVLAGAPRPLVAEEVVVPPRVSATKWIVGLACPIAVFLFVLAHVKWTPVRSDQTVLCIIGGFFFAGLMAPVYTVLLRGRSTSHREILSMRITTFLFAPLLVPGVLLSYNGAFDDSKERMTDMKIVHVSKDDEDDKFYAKTVDSRGSEHQYTFHDQPKEGAYIRIGWKDGALGWTWESGDATVLEGPGKP